MNGTAFSFALLLTFGVAAIAAPSTCILDVMRFGAKGDGHTIDTPAIIRAISAAYARGPGCTVLFPSGHVFLATPFNISNHTAIEISDKTILRFPSNRTYHPVISGMDWWGAPRYQPFIFCRDFCDGVVIKGKGTIDGQGQGWWAPRPYGMGPVPMRLPPVIVDINHGVGVGVYNISIIQCPFVCLHAGHSDNFLIDGITVSNPIDSPNTACIYMDSLVSSRITNSTFSCGDDHITVLAITRHAQNVTIDNSVFLHGQGLTIGSQVAHGMTNVTYRNLTMRGALTGIRMKAQRPHGGDISGLTYEFIELRDVGIAITVELDFTHIGNVSTNPPHFNGVTLRNVTGWGDLASFIECLPEAPCLDWHLENVFPDNTSEIVLPYHCEHLYGVCKNCGSWPRLCPGIKRMP